MARAYLTEKQMPLTFWFYAGAHAAHMMNAIPGKIHGLLVSPILLVHGIGHNKRTWVPIFSLCYFHHKKDGEQKCFKNLAHTMDGIIVGRSPTLNALLVYNPHNKQYYKSDSYRIGSYQLPDSVYRNIKYGGGLFCTIVCNDNLLTEKKCPPRAWLECFDPSTKMLLVGTLMDIPFPDDLLMNGAPSYTILFDNSTSISVPLSEMATIIPKPPVDISPSDSQDSLLPPFLCLNSKITYNTMGNITKVTSASRKVSIGLFSNLMSTSVKNIGMAPSPTSPRLGLICASREFSSLNMSHIPVFGPLIPLSNQHLIPLPCSSVL
jgi:hypothetical protein